jgi:serine/threonine-protein kinase
VQPDPLGFLARCSTEARITPRTLGFKPHKRGPDDYWYPAFLTTGTPASSQGVSLNIRSGPIRAHMAPLLANGEEPTFIVEGEAVVTPMRVYVELHRIQLPSGAWLPLCGVAFFIQDMAFGLPTHAAQPELSVPPPDPALVDSRPGSAVLSEPRMEIFIQPANPDVRPSFLRMPPPERR